MNDAPSPMLRAWLTVALLWFVGCLNYLDRVMITTMRQSLVEAIPMTDAQFGLLTTVFLFVYAVLSPFAGFLADRFNRSRVIVFSLIAWSAITWLTAHATTYAGLLTTRALMGVSEACYIPAALALIADYHGVKTRSLANGAHLSGVMVGAGLGGVGGWIAERHGWAQAFVWFGQLGIVLAVAAALYLRDRRAVAPAGGAAAAPAEKVRLGEAMRSLFGRPQFVMALCYWGLLGASSWAVVGWMPTYLNERFNLTQGAAGLSATGWYQGAALVGVIFGGAWADWWSRTRPHAPMLVPLIGLCIAAPAILVAASSGTFAVAIAGLALFGLTKAFTDANMMPILTLVADPRYRATGYGVLNLCACIVGGATIYAGGALRDAKVNVNTIFLFGSASVVVCAVLLYLVLPRRSATATSSRS
ncbi:MAG: MFS transporter [Verrucomicrobia bacterium]|nr:MFS transporter [Verrucomicrobiota bacterium]